MYDIITIGSAFQDVYLFSKRFKVLKDTRVITGEVECFAFGTKIELDDILFEVGGGGTNTAYTLARQGLKVACLTKVGADGAGEEVKKVLKKAKISTDLVVTDQRRRTAHSIVFLGPNGERTLLVYRGASHYFDASDVKFNKLKNTRWLYITSIGGNFSLLKKIVSFASKNKIKIAINPGKLELEYGIKKLKPIFNKVNILFLNREETAQIFKRSYSDEKGIMDDISKLSTNVSIVTEGEKGCLACFNKNIYRISIHPVKAVDTTGAGDAFGSGFVAGFIKWGSFDKAIRLATANSAAEVKIIGAKQGILGKYLLKKEKWPRITLLNHH